MDIVIPLVEHTGNNFAELRFALRSYEKYMPHSRVIIVGPAIPEWMRESMQRGECDLCCFVDSSDPKFREANIFLKVRNYVEKVNDEDDFIFANDDYYLLREWNPLPPYPHKGKLSVNLFGRSNDDPYRKVIRNTIKLVGDDANNLDVHAPMVMNPKIFKRVFGDRSKPEEYATRIVDWRTPFGFLFKTLYGQHFPDYPSVDIKFNLLRDVNEDVLADLPFFTTNDPACGAKLEEILTKLFPNPSRYEQ